jgi:hypothetical protein
VYLLQDRSDTVVYFEPDVFAGELPIEGSIRSLPGCRCVIDEYQSSLKGKPFRGRALYDFNSISGRSESACVDAFHMATNMMIPEGPGSVNGFSLLGSYRGPGGGPLWSWRTNLGIEVPDRITITACNSSPADDESKVIETTYASEQARR